MSANGTQQQYEQLADALSRLAPVKARALAKELGREYVEVRDALIKLESHGIAYRTGRTRGTRWWLG